MLFVLRFIGVDVDYRRAVHSRLSVVQFFQKHVNYNNKLSQKAMNCFVTFRLHGYSATNRVSKILLLFIYTVYRNGPYALQNF